MSFSTWAKDQQLKIYAYYVSIICIIYVLYICVYVHFIYIYVPKQVNLYDEWQEFVAYCFQYLVHLLSVFEFGGPDFKVNGTFEIVVKNVKGYWWRKLWFVSHFWGQMWSTTLKFYDSYNQKFSQLMVAAFNGLRKGGRIYISSFSMALYCLKA